MCVCVRVCSYQDLMDRDSDLFGLGMLLGY